MLRLNNPYLSLPTLISEFQKRVIEEKELSSEVALDRFQKNLKKIYTNILGQSDEGLLSMDQLERYQTLSNISPQLLKGILTVICHMGMHLPLSLRSADSPPKIILEELLECQKEVNLYHALKRFRLINQTGGDYFHNPTPELIALFEDLSERCHAVSTFFEDSELKDRSLSDNCAYKLMVLFLGSLEAPVSQDTLNLIAAKADKYLRRVDIKPRKPLHDLIFIKRFPRKEDLSDLDGWKRLIEKCGVNAMIYFEKALKIEEKSGRKAPATLKEAESFWAQCFYTRANEDLSFAYLCYKYAVSEKDFSAAIDYMHGPQKGARKEGWPKKSVNSDNIPNIVVAGQNEAAGYYWVKFPSDDKRALILGNITDCCQHIGGDSEICVTEACELENNAVYVLLKAKSQKAQQQPLFGEKAHINYEHFKIIGQSYVWLSQNGNICLDSIEFLEDQISDEALKAITLELGQAFLSAHPEIYFVNVGIGGKTPKKIFPKSLVPEKMLQGTPYGDANNQYTIAQRYLSKTDASEFYLEYAKEKLYEYYTCYLSQDYQTIMLQIFSDMSYDEKELYLANMSFLLPILVSDLENPSQIEPLRFCDYAKNLLLATKKAGDSEANTADFQKQLLWRMVLAAKTTEELSWPLAKLCKKTSLEKALRLLSFISDHEIKTELKSLYDHVLEKLFSSANHELLEKHFQMKDTALVRALMRANKQDLQRLKDFGVSFHKKIHRSCLTWKFGSDCTPLLISCCMGSKKITKFLVEHGADMSDKDFDGHGALHYALKSHNFSVINFVLKNDHKFESEECAAALAVAAQKNKIKTMRLLLNQHASPNLTITQEKTALIIAATEGHAEMVKFLLEKGAHPNVLGMSDGRTALIHACHKGYTNIVRLLLKNGANPNLTDDNHERTPLIFSCYHRSRVEIVKLLLKNGADVEAQDSYGKTALMRAAGHGSTEIVRALLKHGVALDRQDEEGATALILACRRAQTPIVKMLLSQGADPNLTTKYGETALISVCCHRNEQHFLGFSTAVLREIVELLTDNGAFIEHQDCRGKNARDYAKLNGHAEIETLLSEKELFVGIFDQHNSIRLSSPDKTITSRYPSYCSI